MVETLVRAGADLNMRNNLDLCAFEIAVGQNQEHLTGFLAEESIAFSVRQFDMANMIRHVRAGAAPNTANGAGWTPLHFASAFGHYDEAHELLYLGANINQEENDGWTALLFASNNNHADIVRLLLENGARADHVSLNNHTARNLAELGGHADVLEVLDSFAPRSDVERTLGEEASQSDADEIRALEDSGKDTITAEATGAVGTGSDDAKRKKNGFFLWN
ncbi:ankyrin repeat domain-containing protein [archaeon]|nr:MAG: ankyrin repeat domain-containing protein [archaeon]